MRHVEVTERSVKIDGRDISDMVYSVDVSINADGVRSVTFGTFPDKVVLDLLAVDTRIENVPLDGIDRLRVRLDR